MRILHTADWHLGKKLEGRQSLIAEQRAVLDELSAICEANKPDVIIVAGDVFDTFVPPAEAEELFYETALKLSRGSLFAAIAGNHDDPQRLAAPSGLAKASGIVLCGSGDNSLYTGGAIEGGNGYIRYRKNGETLNLAMLPYPSESRMGFSAGTSFAENVKNKIEECCGGFGDGINVFASHLFMSGAAGELSDERELGGAALLPTEVLPPNAVYTALGHIHKPFKVSDSAYYSGSIMPYSFDDVSQKRVVIIDTDGKNTHLTNIPLANYKHMVTADAADFFAAEKALTENGGAFVAINYIGTQPLSAREVNKLRSYGNFVKITAQRPIAEKGESTRRGKSDRQLFEMYYSQKYSKAPGAELTDLFLELLGGEDNK